LKTILPITVFLALWTIERKLLNTLSKLNIGNSCDCKSYSEHIKCASSLSQESRPPAGTVSDMKRNNDESQGKSAVTPDESKSEVKRIDQSKKDHAASLTPNGSSSSCKTTDRLSSFEMLLRAIDHVEHPSNSNLNRSTSLKVCRTVCTTNPAVDISSGACHSNQGILVVVEEIDLTADDDAVDKNKRVSSLERLLSKSTDRLLLGTSQPVHSGCSSSLSLSSINSLMDRVTTVGNILNSSTDNILKGRAVSSNVKSLSADRERSWIQETRVQYPSTPHEWLDEGRLLLLTDPRGAHNMAMFRHQWRRAVPVLVSNCHHDLDSSLWTPVAFSEEFGHLPNDLVDCSRKGRVIRGHTMNKFWEGFECMGDRMTDEQVRKEEYYSTIISINSKLFAFKKTCLETNRTFDFCNI